MPYMSRHDDGVKVFTPGESAVLCIALHTVMRGTGPLCFIFMAEIPD